MTISRRHFLQRGAAFSLGFAGLHSFLAARPTHAALVGNSALGYGDLIKDPMRILDLPDGFKYSIISRTGDTMNDGLLVPGQPDGMASFPGDGGRTILIRNHEVAPGDRSLGAFGSQLQHLEKVKPELVYDYGKGRLPGLGGTTTVVFNTATQQVEKQFLSLAGTYRNCAGGPTPWNSWLTCEEDDTNPGGNVEKIHGYVFEVPASMNPGLAAPIPIRAMGRFKHEAVAVDPRTGIVYLTEDREDGLIYRYLPDSPGRLHRGGRLQALAVRDQQSCITRNWKSDTNIPVGTRLQARWMDLVNIEPLNDDLRTRGHAAGAALFARGEGMWYGRESVYFAATTGGIANAGQIWKYTPSASEGTKAEEKEPGTLELFVEPNDLSVVDNADNLTVAPWGDLIVCEDGYRPDSHENYLLGITPQGTVYKFALNAKSGSEFAGVNFSPDGTTMFVALQSDGLTLAITGPWRKA